MENDNLTQAYQTVFDGEKAMLVALRDLINKFQTDVQSSVGMKSADTPQTPAQQFVGRVQATLANLTSFDLPNVLQQYSVITGAGTNTGATPA